MAHRRLKSVLDVISSASDTPIGTLKLGNVEYSVPNAQDPSKLPTLDTLELNNEYNREQLHFLLQKFILGQDIFLVSQPGPYARRLAMTFASIINSEYEYIALHRDVGEGELKQGKELRAGELVYVDGPAVKAAKFGRILILEGIEKAERGIMPILNNLLENREINLDDGTNIIEQRRFDLLDDKTTGHFPCSRNFRVIAIGAPTPPFPGFPLDPPFRSRFQARFVDPLSSSLALCAVEATYKDSLIWRCLREIISATQLANESNHALISKSPIPPFPQTALSKLGSLLARFPPPAIPSPTQLRQIILLIHPMLTYWSPNAWQLLSKQLLDYGLELASLSPVSSSDSAGLLGYHLQQIERVDSTSVRLLFGGPLGVPDVTHIVSSGPNPLRAFPPQSTPNFQVTTRFLGLLTCLIQAHCIGWDVSLVPPVNPSSPSSSTTTVIRNFAELLGYEIEVLHLYKDVSGRELIMRRKILDQGETIYEPSSIITGAKEGKLVHIASFDVIGSTANALARLIQDREIELWDNDRLTSSNIHPSFRIIGTASNSQPMKDWLSEEHANLFLTVPSQPMQSAEEEAVLLSTGCPHHIITQLLRFANKYRSSISADAVHKTRRIGTRSLVRIARRIARFPHNFDLHHLLRQTLLAEFLPVTERLALESFFTELDIRKSPTKNNPSPILQGHALLFPDEDALDRAVNIPLFRVDNDPNGVASLIPHMEHFYDNSLQTGVMREIAIDLELLKEHLILLGNQGVGKNKIVDRLCQLLGRPREYMQLHRDTTANQLMFTIFTDRGSVQYTDSPLLRAIKFGRVIVIDEADKAPEHVVAIFRSLAAQSEMTLPDGRRVCRPQEGKKDTDIEVHPDFRLILLANRPGYPFLGNQFVQVLGENFSPHAVPNPDQLSERHLLAQLAPSLNVDLIKRLVLAFQDLRADYDKGLLGYPYSLRELINLVRHLHTYPENTLGEALRNVFDYDIYRPETMDRLAEVLEHQGLSVSLGLGAIRNSQNDKVKEIQFKPKETLLDQPKQGEHDGKEHSGGNRFAGGTGGRDTAGMGGRGGYKRFYKGGDIKQIPEQLKDQVPDHVKERAREMARQELQRRLEELDMSIGDANGYAAILRVIETHVSSLHNLFENLAAREEERVWVKRQFDGEFDDTRIIEGLTGESAVYKRRTMEKPQLGRPQLKPKRIRFVLDLSASMYRFQYDGRLQRTIETAAMLMETFDRLSRKEKYLWDIYAHSGDGPDIALVEANNPPSNMKDRWKVLEKMNLIPQYAFAGDYTLEGIQKGIEDVAKADADDWFLIALTDANFGQYYITPEQLINTMKRYPKVRKALICIGESAESTWVTKSLPGQAYRVTNTSDIPLVLRSILSNMVDNR